MTDLTTLAHALTQLVLADKGQADLSYREEEIHAVNAENALGDLIARNPNSEEAKALIGLVTAIIGEA